MPKKHGRDDLPAFFRESPNDLEKVSRKKVVVLLDFVQMRGRGALPKFVVHFSQTVYWVNLGMGRGGGRDPCPNFLPHWRSKKVVQVVQIEGWGGRGNLNKIQKNGYFFS